MVQPHILRQISWTIACQECVDSPRRSSTTWNARTASTNVTWHALVIVNASWSTNARITLDDARTTSNGWYTLTTIDASRIGLDGARSTLNDARPASTTNAPRTTLDDAYVTADAVTRYGNAWLTYGWHATTDAYAVTYGSTSTANVYAIARYAHGTTLDVVPTAWHAARYVTNATSDGRHASTKHDGHARQHDALVANDGRNVTSNEHGSRCTLFL